MIVLDNLSSEEKNAVKEDTTFISLLEVELRFNGVQFFFFVIQKLLKMIPIDDLNPKENEAVEEFKRRMQNVLPSKYYQDRTVFYRFLKARDFDQNKAEIMLRKHIIWRKAYQIDTILEDFKPKEVFFKYFQPALIGQDKVGDLVVYIPCGKQDSKDTFKSLKFREIMRNIAYFVEKMLKLETPTFGNQAILIMDMDEITFSNATCKTSRDFMQGVIQINQDNYPERLKSLIAINAPNYCLFMAAILKSVMSNAMLQKISVYGRDGWKERLLEMVDSDVLPAFLGGNRTDPDGNPMCNTFVIHGGTISPKYFLSDEERYFKDRSQVKVVSIPPKEKREIYVDVTERGSQIHWRFLVKGRDIKFGLFLEKPEHDVEEILPEVKYSTPDGTADGSYKCQSIGKYAIIFDNSYSWVSSKEVEYCVSVETING